MNNNKEQLLKKILEYPLWRQRIKLNEDGFSTHGYLILPDEWEILKLPTSLKNLSFLDVGSNDGYFSFEAERRQAKNITALDVYKEIDFLSMTSGWCIEGINLAKEYMGSSVKIVSGSIYALDNLNEKFDISFCNNVIAWIRDIPLAIEQLCNVTNQKLIIQDQFDIKSSDNIIGDNYDINILSLDSVKKELIKNGWTQIKIININEFKRNRKQFEQFELAKSKGKIDVYLNPDEDLIEKQIEFQENRLVLSERNGKCYIKQIGWVNKNDLIKYNKHKGLRSLLKGLIGGDIIDYFKSKFDKRTNKDLLIIATKN